MSIKKIKAALFVFCNFPEGAIPSQRVLIPTQKRSLFSPRFSSGRNTLSLRNWYIGLLSLEVWVKKKGLNQDLQDFGITMIP